VKAYESMQRQMIIKAGKIVKNKGFTIKTT
jgi:hypothetical protein